MWRIALVGLVAVALLAPSAGAKNAPFVGTWKGTVKASAGTTQRIVLKVGPKVKSNNSGSVVYASPACTGKLAFLKQSGRVLTLRETITKGSCPNGGSLVLHQIDFRTLYVEWWGTGASSASFVGYLALGG